VLLESVEYAGLFSPLPLVGCSPIDQLDVIGHQKNLIQTSLLLQTLRQKPYLAP